MINFEKIIGWTLLFLGIVIIIYTLYFSFNIFTAKATPPEIFKVAQKQEPLPKKEVKPLDIEAQMEKIIGEQLKGMLPTDVLPKLLNLISWSIFAGILIFGGAQISNLGIKLIKK